MRGLLMLQYRTAGAIILRISHGYEVEEKEDPFVTLADRATEQFSLSTAPGFLVNLVPACESADNKRLVCIGLNFRF